MNCENRGKLIILVTIYVMSSINGLVRGFDK